MMLKKSIQAVAGLFLISMAFPSQAELPPITGSPDIDTPKLLEWPLDIPSVTPDLTEPTSNRIFDLHAQVADCNDVDMILSTAGNYHMALQDLWYEHYLPENPDLVKNWYYSTSPPISPEQTVNKNLTFANVRLKCAPHLAVGPKGLMTTLQQLQVTDGAPVAVIQNYGNVILVKKGNPKKIRSIWDLGRRGVKVVTSNPYTEPGSFNNYRKSLYNIALNDPNPPRGWTADRLYNAVFNGGIQTGKEQNKHRHAPNKWLAGKRIHHREVPWSVAYGQADAGLLFYHLALYMVRQFPDQFEIVPLGGTADAPEPLPGNNIGTMFMVKIAGNLTTEQYEARERLMAAYQSTVFDEILTQHGLRRPY